MKILLGYNNEYLKWIEMNPVMVFSSSDHSALNFPVLSISMDLFITKPKLVIIHV